MCMCACECVYLGGSLCMGNRIINHRPTDLLNNVMLQVLKVRVRTSDVEGLSQNAHLIVTVWDHDTFNSHDLIGVCVFSFARILSELKDKSQFDFEEVLSSNGVVTGTLRGTIALKGEYPVGVKAFSSSLGQMTAALSLASTRAQNGCGCVLC